MTDEQRTKISKFLSKHLRHQPERLGLTLLPGGWVAVDDLLAACARHRFPISRAQLEDAVAENSKQRFGFDETGTMIRANQGHSVGVDLGLEPVTPPDVLHHGTGHQSIESILREGLDKRNRHHVHLSADMETARAVGARHGRPVIFDVASGAMHADGFVFYRSDNGVWLTGAVPPKYLSLRQGLASEGR